MQYKTIALELLQQRTELHEQLRSTRTLLSALESCARELKSSHETWKGTLSQARPGSNLDQIASEALELALQELAKRLDSESPFDEWEALPLDEAMNYLRSRSSHE